MKNNTQEYKFRIYGKRDGIFHCYYVQWYRTLFFCKQWATLYSVNNLKACEEWLDEKIKEVKSRKYGVVTQETI